jgi:hypothetical protein
MITKTGFVGCIGRGLLVVIRERDVCDATNARIWPFCMMM